MQNVFQKFPTFTFLAFHRGEYVKFLFTIWAIPHNNYLDVHKLPFLHSHNITYTYTSESL